MSRSTCGAEVGVRCGLDYGHGGGCRQAPPAPPMRDAKDELLERADELLSCVTGGTGRFSSRASRWLADYRALRGGR